MGFGALTRVRCRTRVPQPAVLGSWLNVRRSVRYSGAIPLEKVPPALTADLSHLSEALDDPDVDIADLLRRLGAVAELAVRSSMGVTVSSVLSGREITLSTLQRDTAPGDIATSLCLSLPRHPATGE